METKEKDKEIEKREKGGEKKIRENGEKGERQREREKRERKRRRYERIGENIQIYFIHGNSILMLWINILAHSHYTAM